MPDLNTFPVARKRYNCDGVQPGCTDVIEPGVRYLKSACPPNDAVVGNVGWLNNRLCPPCAAYYKTPVPEAVAS